MNIDDQSIQAMNHDEYGPRMSEDEDLPSRKLEY